VFVLYILSLCCSLLYSSTAIQQHTQRNLPALDTVNRGVLPICASTIDEYSHFCQCESIPWPCNKTALQSPINVIQNMTERAQKVAETLIDLDMFDLIPGSAQILGPPIGVGVIEYGGSCHILASEDYGFTDAIAISTGDAYQALKHINHDGSTSGSFYERGYENIWTDPLIPDGRDCSALVFEVMSKSNLTVSVAMEYVFMSEEYPEFVHNIFNDHFVFLLDEKPIDETSENLAQIGDSGEDVSINSINYVENLGLFRLCSPYTSYDGHTVKLRSKGHIIRPFQHHYAKLLICDVGDDLYDSVVVIKSKSFAICEGGDPQINCPQDRTQCPGPVQLAYAQDSCGTSLNVSRVDEFGEAPVIREEPYTIIYEVLNESNAPYPESIQCSFKLTVQDEPPQISNVYLQMENGLNNSAENPLHANETFTLHFDILAKCCALPGSGVVYWGDGESTPYEYSQVDSIALTHAYVDEPQGTVIVIEAVDCYGEEARVEVLVIPPPCGAPQIIPVFIVPKPAEVGVKVGFMFQVISRCLQSWTITYGDGNTSSIDSNPEYCVESHDGYYKCLATNYYSSCGQFPITYLAVDKNGLSAVANNSALVVNCSSTPSPSPSPSPSVSPSPTPTETPTQNPCEPGFIYDPETQSCYKPCVDDIDCTMSGVCSGSCLSSGRCAGTQDDICSRGCCKATPGRIPGTLSNAICSNGCGQSNCCIEQIENGCNSLPSIEDMEESCTMIYGNNLLCDPADPNACAGFASESCILVHVGKVHDYMCSLKCELSAGANACPEGYTCKRFIYSGPTPLSFCLRNELLA